VSAQPLTNRDLLAWFSEEERAECSGCGERTSVSLPDVFAQFCLGCGAVTVAGERLDVDGRIVV
jgi:hypothetical protein